MALFKGEAFIPGDYKIVVIGNDGQREVVGVALDEDEAGYWPQVLAALGGGFRAVAVERHAGCQLAKGGGL